MFGNFWKFLESRILCGKFLKNFTNFKITTTSQNNTISRAIPAQGIISPVVTFKLSKKFQKKFQKIPNFPNIPEQFINSAKIPKTYQKYRQISQIQIQKNPQKFW